MSGYLIQIDHRLYEKKGGGPFTLPEAFAEVRGCGHCKIWSTTGRLVLDNAGSMYARSKIRGRAVRPVATVPYMRHLGKVLVSA